MKKNSYISKTLENAIQDAKIDLQENEENLIIIEKGIKKNLLLNKVEIEVIEKREVINYIKEYTYNLLKMIGLNAIVEVKKGETIPTFLISSDNDSLLIGKNGKNLHALETIVHQSLKKQINTNFKFILDVNSYNEKRKKSIEKLAINIAKEVSTSKVEVKLDSMNSYERRLVHQVLSNNKYVYTKSTGDEPNRCVIIKPKDE